MKSREFLLWSDKKFINSDLNKLCSFSNPKLLQICNPSFGLVSELDFGDSDTTT